MLEIDTVLYVWCPQNKSLRYGDAGYVRYDVTYVFGIFSRPLTTLKIASRPFSILVSVPEKHNHLVRYLLTTLKKVEYGMATSIWTHTAYGLHDQLWS